MHRTNAILTSDNLMAMNFIRYTVGLDVYDRSMFIYGELMGRACSLIGCQMTDDKLISPCFPHHVARRKFNMTNETTPICRSGGIKKIQILFNRTF